MYASLWGWWMNASYNGENKGKMVFLLITCAWTSVSIQNYRLVVADNGKEILSMNEVLSYMLRSSKMLCEETELSNLLKLDESEWQNYVGEVRGMIVTYPGMVRNSSILNVCQLNVCHCCTVLGLAHYYHVILTPCLLLWLVLICYDTQSYLAPMKNKVCQLSRLLMIKAKSAYVSFWRPDLSGLNFVDCGWSRSGVDNVAIFSTRQHAERTICYRKSVCVSVCLSVTRVDQSKTVELRVVQFSPYSSPNPLLYAV